MATRVYQLSVQGLLLSSYRENVLHFQTGGSNDNDTLAGAESLINAFVASGQAQFLATLPASYSLVRLTARRVDLKPSATACKNYGYNTAIGTRSSDGGPQQVSPSVFLVPTMGTKSGGRIFWPAIPNGDLVQNTIGATWQGLVNTLIATLVAGIANAGITWTLGVYSKKLNSVANVASHSFSPVIGFQGRRRRPVGAV